MTVANTSGSAYESTGIMARLATGDEGPYTLEQVRGLARAKTITPETLISYGGKPFVPAGTGTQVFSDKSWAVAALLSFFFGVFGVDRFYVGQTGVGVAKLLLSWATFGVWPLIDFVLFLLRKVDDSQGRPLR